MPQSWTTDRWLDGPSWGRDLARGLTTEIAQQDDQGRRRATKLRSACEHLKGLEDAAESTVRTRQTVKCCPDQTSAPGETDSTTSVAPIRGLSESHSMGTAILGMAILQVVAAKDECSQSADGGAGWAGSAAPGRPSSGRASRAWPDRHRSKWQSSTLWKANANMLARPAEPCRMGPLALAVN